MRQLVIRKFARQSRENLRDAEVRLSQTGGDLFARNHEVQTSRSDTPWRDLHTVKRTLVIELAFLLLAFTAWFALRHYTTAENLASATPPVAGETHLPKSGNATHVMDELLKRSFPDQLASQRQVFVRTSEDKVLRDQMLDLFNQIRDIKVTNSEAAQIADRYSFYQTVRGAFEAEIATVTNDQNSLHISIPRYPRAGEALREMLSDDFKRVLGADRGDKAFNELQSTFDTLFRGFGADGQIVEMQYQGKAGPNGDDMYRVVRTQIAPSSRTVPGNNNFQFTGATSTATVASSQLDSGEFAYFRPFLQQITPKN